jgi:hypothetical protein
MVLGVSKRRRILKRMAGVRTPLPEQGLCDIIYCDNIGLAGFPCEHRVCGFCMIKLIHIVQLDSTYEYLFDCPCCRHQYSLNESIVKRLIYEYGKDHVMENVRCGCKTCNMIYCVKLIPCEGGCICAESTLSHSVHYNAESQSEPENDSDTESYNVCFLNEDGESDRMQDMLSDRVH